MILSYSDRDLYLLQVVSRPLLLYWASYSQEIPLKDSEAALDWGFRSSHFAIFYLYN